MVGWSPSSEWPHTQDYVKSINGLQRTGRGEERETERTRSWLTRRRNGGVKYDQNTLHEHFQELVKKYF